MGRGSQWKGMDAGRWVLQTHTGPVVMKVIGQWMVQQGGDCLWITMSRDAPDAVVVDTRRKNPQIHLVNRYTPSRWG